MSNLEKFACKHGGFLQTHSHDYIANYKWFQNPLTYMYRHEYEILDLLVKITVTINDGIIYVIIGLCIADVSTIFQAFSNRVVLAVQWHIKIDQATPY